MSCQKKKTCSLHCFLFQHAGEVYGEKAILATELRELQSRALSLSVERDKYLDVLSEVHFSFTLLLVPNLPIFIPCPRYLISIQ